MKKYIFAIICLITSFSASAIQFEGVVKQEGNQELTITVYDSEGNVEIVNCDQEKTFFGLNTKTTFSLNLEKDTHYTLVFAGDDEDKYVYVDTHNMRPSDVLVCNLYDYDAVIYFEPLYGYPIASYMDTDCLQWVCKTFPEVRDYTSQLIEQGEEIVDCQ